MALIFSVVAWLLVVCVTLPAAFRLTSGKGDDHDATKWAFFLVSLLFLLFNFRWIVAPDSQLALDILRICSIALALYLVAVVRYYNRVS